MTVTRGSIERFSRLRRAALYVALGAALLLLALDRGAAYLYRPGPGATDVVIYTTEWCPYCAALRTHLTGHGIPFEELDVERTLRGGMAFWALRGSGVPVAVIGPDVVHGFDLGEIDRSLARLGYRVGTRL
jgi:glutaredoxin